MTPLATRAVGQTASRPMHRRHQATIHSTAIDDPLHTIAEYFDTVFGNLGTMIEFLIGAGVVMAVRSMNILTRFVNISARLLNAAKSRLVLCTI